MVLLLAGCGTDPPASEESAQRGPAHTSPLTHVLSDASDGAIGITVTIPSADWFGPPGAWYMERNPGFGPPDGAGIIAFVVDEKF